LRRQLFQRITYVLWNDIPVLPVPLRWDPAQSR
jgi:hypothetical protein